MQYQLSRRIAPTLALTVLFTLAGCGSDSSPSGPGSALDSEEGTLALGIRVDEGVAKSEGSPPVPEWITALHLTFDSIVAYRTPAECDSCDSTGPSAFGRREEGAAEPVEILVDPVTVEIMELGTALTGLLAEADLPEGHYPKLELGLTEVWVVTDEESTITVSLPPPGDSLLKIVAPFDVVGGEATALVLVIDLGRSLHGAPPGSGNLVLRPVIRGEVVPHGEALGWHADHGGGNGESAMGEEGGRGGSMNGNSGGAGSGNGSDGNAGADPGGNTGGAGSGR